MSENKFYITTPIYYGTAKPHLGSLYSTLLADVFARWHKIEGYKTFFLTGTDEHGQKVAQAAQKVNKDPKSFVDGFVDTYKKTWADYNLGYDKFIRTTDTEHIKAVQAWILQAKKNGDIYKSSYSGWYCTPCETFVTAENGEKEPLCVSCSRVTNFVSEESYFFKLSAYQEKLLKFYKEHPHFITPHERAAEVISFVESGLHDLSISRTSISWGVPFPGDEKHVVYVWVDALLNYISAIGYADEKKQEEFKFWWPVDIQVIGKDIVRFHAIYWPAFLMAVGIQPPHQLLVHGWIKVGDQKMSKSLGNAVDPYHLLNTYGVDEVRYFLSRYITVTHDTEFSIADLEQRITTDLANDLGNLLNRMLVLAIKQGTTTIAQQTTWSDEASKLRDESFAMLDDYQKYMRERTLHTALARVWKFINQANSFFHAQEPWKLAKNDQQKFTEVIAAICNSLHVIALVLWPIMPKKMVKLMSCLGITIKAHDVNAIVALREQLWQRSFVLQQIEPLFAKIEPQQKEASPEIQIKNQTNEQENNNYITIDDLKKVEIRVGTIEQCETIEQSDKLYKMQVDFGTHGKRQILAGVRAYYKAEELIGKQAPFVVNLKPRPMLGLVSEGMMLVAKDAQNLSLMNPHKKITNGSCLQ